MKREIAEHITMEYTKPIYCFALKRCVNLQDAEDLAQEIVLKIFQALQTRDDLESVDKFIWTVAHNALNNYYRRTSRMIFGSSFEDQAEILCSDENVERQAELSAVYTHLYAEIAFLSKIQRRVVIAYYFENKKQEAIAEELGIPLGTVKWHLFESKKDLRKGMNTMRPSSELKFNPIQFTYCSTGGSTGTKGANSNFFRSALSQNIVYTVWKEGKTVNEIADVLGVSPVYVESEAEYLAEYGFLIQKGNRYLCNILLEEPSDDLIQMEDEMYEKAAALFANALFDELTSGASFYDKDIICGQQDLNFVLWALIPYITELSGTYLVENRISFEQAATIRPDGGHNICCASVYQPGGKYPRYTASMQNWRGPCWNANSDYTIWQIDSEWSLPRIGERYPMEIERILSCLSRGRQGGTLTPEEYSFLAAKGIVKICDTPIGCAEPSLQVICLTSAEVKKRLIAVGDRIKERCWPELNLLKKPFVKAMLAETPEQLRMAQKFYLQNIFFSDGSFILHCLKELVNCGKLKIPQEHQRNSLSTIIISNQ